MAAKFKVGDKVRYQYNEYSGGVRVAATVYEVTETLALDSEVGERGPMRYGYRIKSANPIYVSTAPTDQTVYMESRLVAVEPPKFKYRAYIEVEATDEADALRRAQATAMRMERID